MIIDISQPAMVGAAPAVYARTDTIGSDVILYYCVQNNLDIHPFRLDGVPYSALEITSLGLSGSEAPAPLVNQSISTDTLYLINRRGAYSVVRDLNGPAGEAILLASQPDGVIRVTLEVEGIVPTSVVSTEIMDVNLALRLA